MSKLALHMQSLTPWAEWVVNTYWKKPRWLKVMIYGINNPNLSKFTGTNLIARGWTHGGDTNEWERACVAKGTSGGREYFDFMRPVYEAYRNIVAFWEFINEPPLSNIIEAYAYRDALIEWNRLMHLNGFKTCGGSIGVGNPKLLFYDGDNQVLRIIGPALALCNLWSYHAYFKRPYTPNDLWWAHRYRLIIAELAVVGIKLPDCVITEGGADIGGGHNDGWYGQYNGDWGAFFADLKSCAIELEKDSYVLAYIIFTSGPNDDWDWFDINEQHAKEVGAWNTPVAPPHLGLPEDETTKDPATMAEKIRWWSEESQREFENENYLRANDIRISNIQLCYRLENILKGGG